MNAPVLIQVVTLRCAKALSKRIPQGEVGATSKAIIKEVAFNRWANYTGAKDVTEFDAAKEADVIFRVNFESGFKIRMVRSNVGLLSVKVVVVAAVLIDIRTRVDRSVEAESIHWWRRRRRDLLVDIRPSLKRGGKKSCERNSGE